MPYCEIIMLIMWVAFAITIAVCQWKERHKRLDVGWNLLIERSSYYEFKHFQHDFTTRNIGPM